MYLPKSNHVLIWQTSICWVLRVLQRPPLLTGHSTNVEGMLISLNAHDCSRPNTGVRSRVVFSWSSLDQKTRTTRSRCTWMLCHPAYIGPWLRVWFPSTPLDLLLLLLLCLALALSLHRLFQGISWPHGLYSRIQLVRSITWLRTRPPRNPPLKLYNCPMKNQSWKTPDVVHRHWR